MKGLDFSMFSYRKSRQFTVHWPAQFLHEHEDGIIQVSYHSICRKISTYYGIIIILHKVQVPDDSFARSYCGGIQAAELVWGRCSASGLGVDEVELATM
jgi:hypothetical protein